MSLSPDKKEAIKHRLSGGDATNKYYVYALCEKKTDGRLIPFYVGKGETDRLWDHEAGEGRERSRIEKLLDPDEKQAAIQDLSKKYKRISDVGSESIERVIVKWGLTASEAFMAESALINLLRLKGIEYSSCNAITNIQNGHASVGEKAAGIEVKARTDAEFYNEYCLATVFLDDIKERIIFVSINKLYDKCKVYPTDELNDVICGAARGIWLADKTPDFLFSVYQQRIIGVYKITERIALRDLIQKKDLSKFNDTFPDKPFREKEAKFVRKNIEEGAIEYQKLSSEAQKLFHAFKRESPSWKETCDLNEEYAKFLKRSYFVCDMNVPETITEKYLFHIVKKRDNGAVVSIFGRGNPIAYSNSAK